MGDYTKTEAEIPEHLRLFIPKGRTTARMPDLETEGFACAVRESNDGTSVVMWIADLRNSYSEDNAVVCIPADMCAKLGDQLLYMAALLKRRESDR